MYYVHKFQDRFARQQAVLQTTRTMLRRFIEVEVAFSVKTGPQGVDIRTNAQIASTFFNMLQDTDELVERWVNANSNPTLDDVCAFASSAVEDFTEEFHERVADMIADRVNGKAS